MQNLNAQKYVVGFMFDELLENVALIRKLKPEWQRGLLNGIGGKIEPGEPAARAMVREFNEEAGFQTFVSTWKNFCSMSGWNNDGSQFEIEFYYNFGPLHRLASVESEQVEVVSINELLVGSEACVGNVPWLVALAKDFAKGVYPPNKVNAFYTPQR